MTLATFRIYIYSCVIVLLHISCEDILFEDDLSDIEVNLLAPVDGITVYEGDVNFSWEEIDYVEQYQLLIATPNFENASQIVLDTIVSSRSFITQLFPGSYEWKLRALNSGYKSEYSASIFTVFESVEFTEREVNLLSPIKGEDSNITNHILSWQSVSDAIEYRIQIWNPDLNGVLEEDQIIASTSYEHDFIEGDFTWQVRAQSETQNTLYSSNELHIDLTPPNDVVLELPIDESILTDVDVEYTWSRIGIEGSIEVDSIYVYSNSVLSELAFKAKGVEGAYNIEMEKGNYFWFVQSFDAAGNKNTKSEVFNFELN